MELVLATQNSGKVREIKEILNGFRLRLKIRSLSDYPKYHAPPERGRTYKDIAIRKAVHAAKSLGRWAVGDDSGIEIAELGGLPGIRSARFAGRGADNAALCGKVVRLLKSRHRPKSAAKFVCVLALSSPKGDVRTFRGVCRGRITLEMRGRKGFGYDPIFVPSGYQRTFAELPAKTKNRVSHRGRAVGKLCRYLTTVL